MPLLSPQNPDPHFRGIDALHNAYLTAAQSVVMSGPTTFAPMIRQAIEISAAYKHEQLIFLVLMTDGDVSNLELDKQAIV